MLKSYHVHSSGHEKSLHLYVLHCLALTNGYLRWRYVVFPLPMGCFPVLHWCFTSGMHNSDDFVIRKKLTILYISWMHIKVIFHWVELCIIRWWLYDCHLQMLLILYIYIYLMIKDYVAQVDFICLSNHSTNFSWATGICQALC